MESSCDVDELRRTVSAEDTKRLAYVDKLAFSCLLQTVLREYEKQRKKLIMKLVSLGEIQIKPVSAP